MSKAQVLLSNHPGPLPIKIEYTPLANVTETLMFSGSIHTGDIARSNIGFEVQVNGKAIGQSTIYKGDTGGDHHATVATAVEYDIPSVIEEGKIKPVTIELVPVNFDSISNKTDHYNLTVFV